VPLTVTLEPNKDNTLYEDATGALSNGLGQYFFAGHTSGVILRSVLAFDLSSIPSNATITSVGLTMVVSQSSGGATNFSLYRALADWGEGTSDASGDETAGATSTTGDATWLHRFYPGTLWSAAGGDFDATSATTSVSGAALYQWSSATLLSDVQGWYSNPSTNFGWVLRGAESGNNRKGFDSRQFADPAQRPKLEVTYVIESTGACCFTNGTCAWKSVKCVLVGNSPAVFVMVVEATVTMLLARSRK
jgi:hypothetical protein